MEVTDDYWYVYDYTGEVDKEGKACGYGIAWSPADDEKGDPYVV